MSKMLMAVSSVGSGDSLIHNLFHLVIILACLGIIYWLGTWVIGKLGVPGIIKTFWDGLFIIIACIVAINFLLSLDGHGFITW